MTLSLSHITHHYTDVPVLQNISVTLKKGEIHALLGMNGAGKSTLLKIATGEISPVAGNIAIHGKSVSFTSPRDAKKHGIAFVTQEVDHGLVPHLSILENVLLDHFAMQKTVLFSKTKFSQLAEQYLQMVGLYTNIWKDISQCSLHEKQLLLIARALSNDASYLLLDEPTSSLGPKEANHFWELLQKLKEQGIGIAFISHRMSEIRAYADSVTVLRNGHIALSEKKDCITDEQIVEAMTGEKIIVQQRETEVLQTPYIFEATNLSLHSNQAPLSLRIRAGEKVVIYGLIGSGKTTLAETLFGIRKPYVAKVNEEEVYIKSPRSAIAAKIALVPEERRKQGLFLSENITNHVNLHQSGWKRMKHERNHTKEAIDSFHILPRDPNATLQSLSGGNQQKVSIAKWIGFQPRIFLLDEPTKGVDVAAKQDIFQFIEKIIGSGSAVVYFTGEQDEALHIADRILILANGAFIGEYRPHELSPEKLLHLSERSHSIEYRS